MGYEPGVYFLDVTFPQGVAFVFEEPGLDGGDVRVLDGQRPPVRGRHKPLHVRHLHDCAVTWNLTVPIRRSTIGGLDAVSGIHRDSRTEITCRDTAATACA